MKDLIRGLITLTTKVTRWLVIIAAICIAFIMIINFVDVIGAKFFGRSVPGALDITEEVMEFMSMAIITVPIIYPILMAAGSTIREGNIVLSKWIEYKYIL